MKGRAKVVVTCFALNVKTLAKRFDVLAGLPFPLLFLSEVRVQQQDREHLLDEC